MALRVGEQDLLAVATTRAAEQQRELLAVSATRAAEQPREQLEAAARSTRHVRELHEAGSSHLPAPWPPPRPPPWWPANIEGGGDAFCGACEGAAGGDASAAIACGRAPKVIARGGGGTIYGVGKGAAGGKAVTALACVVEQMSSYHVSYLWFELAAGATSTRTQSDKTRDGSRLYHGPHGTTRSPKL